ncbi:DeoR/GlpR family DNA-binding transcription regulator [Paraburkholderia caballeronis]|uniref:DNA-binding transcriptional regulator of sugar metabolism, DeoR/GlpR family n=1 Tax=Paraburkholderia caballeronis TaxID=416943 RepID=A0A1H7MT07_9BURK|nr:DeoR/GlpR family DNA-binding transcription regulator [Paraburkholderia caballeronis]PXW26438.1 DeoR family transcriptional regulator [Paraburkholderia caballeronis]PXX01985.1 DeoR family transcriptional regulator [Paraburkholderia caballeronis]RAK01142.1 DeoR family transcriptional regulator [Paraburkholderia caballeronis]SEB95650.1 transcriptional regulator, DeoR family [Paraburkholderia caballeronis]SEL14231.1 DNA-binding transcriptional regulator of sugar metabolism, DeoR/GlpR family [Pa
MLAEERYRRIRALLRDHGTVSVEHMTEKLGVSRETIRRDLVELDTLGEIRRVHGGAMLAESEPPINVRAGIRVKEKRAVARGALTHVRSGQTLFIDAGTTTAILADALTTLDGLHVITNSVAVASKLADIRAARAGTHDVHLVGGTFNASVGATYGGAAISEVYRFHADLALLSPVGVDAAHGATSFFPEEAEMADAMSRNAKQTVILADYSKIGVLSRVVSCPPQRISVLVTNARASKIPGAGELCSAFGAVDYV